MMESVNQAEAPRQHKAAPNGPVARAVVWSEPAWHDLEQVADYIAQDSRHYVATFVREIRDAAALAQPVHRARPRQTAAD